MLPVIPVEPEPDNAPHFDDATLEDYAIGRLSEAVFNRIHKHIWWCPTCRQRADQLGREADLLAHALSRATPIFRQHTETARSRLTYGECGAASGARD